MIKSVCKSISCDECQEKFNMPEEFCCLFECREYEFCEEHENCGINNENFKKERE